MRILTNSSNHLKGLIAISEAKENSPQSVFFCVPIEKFQADKINNLEDFKDIFNNGISTKINDYGLTKTIHLKLDYNFGILELPKFTTQIKGHKIDFYVSKLNLSHDNFNTNSLFDFDYFYQGSKFRELTNNRFMILEPNWKQLDELFLKEDIVFVDWQL
ncbi:hypothetical protein [Chryseobacterium sp. VAUSW3]|uniref:hypothetical protein n=1 Tax=Chryseobacterium sp. VAUSW3 TaxID=2010998 RepID=UPI000B4D6896|nr:hypothetical protein [Chryseobacterium sp. VAUSW3]OWR12857.1 hypothetical protein CDW55_12240 [Chryseobacterium sp. VAUSW3]